MKASPYAIIGPDRVMVDLFDVRTEDEASFREAWAAAAPAAATLHRALREDVQPRYVALSDPPGPDAGVLLIAERPDEWKAIVARWSPRQGFISARVDGDLALIHWSSPLMLQRAVLAEGDLIPRGAVYARA
jgi:hypothetical protein